MPTWQALRDRHPKDGGKAPMGLRKSAEARCLIERIAETVSCHLPHAKVATAPTPKQFYRR
jgi:hypothetical protein